MSIYIARRLVAAIPLLLATSLIVFSFTHLAPGSPETILLGGRNVDEATREAIRTRYHLDDGFLAQYAQWLGGFVTGDFGESIEARDTVANVVGPRVLPTLQLAVYALFLVVVGGIGLGIASAVHRGRAVDALASGFVLVGSAVSTYVSGILLITILAAALGWFPIFGLGDGGLDRIYHLTLPAVALALALTALVARVCRASMTDALRQEYVEVARSRGFSELRVVGKHALRNALVPVVTITGLVFGFLISGTVLVEYTFGLSGLGSLLIQAVQTKDFAVVQAVTMMFAAAFILINLIVDVLYAFIDPRIRIAAAAR